MAGSKHPGLLDKAATHCAECVKETDSYLKDADAWIKAFDKAKAQAKTSTTALKSNTSGLKPVLERYAKVVTAIIGLEEQIEKAKKAKDKEKVKQLEKEHKKTDATATKIREDYRKIDKARLDAMKSLTGKMSEAAQTPIPIPPQASP